MRKPKTEAQRAAASTMMKKQWSEIRAMRPHLGVSLDQILGSYVALRAAGLVQGVSAGTATAVRDAKEIIEGNHMPLFAGEPEVVKKHTNNIPGLGDVKIMLWAIEKVGNVKAARVAFDKACEAVK